MPSEDLENYPDFSSFLDFEGLRYYLPAIMTFALNHPKTFQSGYRILLPCVTPRDVGKGYGEKFDVVGFANNLNLTQTQIIACYRFACYMAIEADEGVNEDQYPAMCKWRTLAGLYET